MRHGFHSVKGYKPVPRVRKLCLLMRVRPMRTGLAVEQRNCLVRRRDGDPGHSVDGGESGAERGHTRADRVKNKRANQYSGLK